MTVLTLSEPLAHLFYNEKAFLNFDSKSDEEFLLFLITTVVKLADSMKPVFGSTPPRSNVDRTVLQRSTASPKKRLNCERFPTQQVNKSSGISQFTDSSENKENTPTNPTQGQPPTRFEDTTKPSTNPCANTPNSSTRKFFSEIEEVSDLRQETCDALPCSVAHEAQEAVRNRRITDCKDRRCKFCASYDPEYAAEQDLLEEEEELEMYGSATEEPAAVSQCGGGSELAALQGSAEVLQHGEPAEEEENQTVCTWQEWSMLTAVDDSSASCPSPVTVVPDRIKGLSHKELRAQLIAKGALVGAVTPATRAVYEQYLVKLETTPLVLLNNSLDGYTRELVSCLQGQPQLDWTSSEREMFEEFQKPVVGRRYRQGTIKCFFNYLLLDPRIADDLPRQSLKLNPREVFKLFVKSIFYIGKGKQSRPYAHLFEASLQNKDTEKLRRIRAIWASGRGVVSLHVYNNTIAEEAFTREAVLIMCIGMKKLSNEKKGELYGVGRGWTAARQRGVGLALLYKAHLTLLNEGHREIRQADISKRGDDTCRKLF